MFIKLHRGVSLAHAWCIFSLDCFARELIATESHTLASISELARVCVAFVVRVVVVEGRMFSLSHDTEHAVVRALFLILVVWWDSESVGKTLVGELKSFHWAKLQKKKSEQITFGLAVGSRNF